MGANTTGADPWSIGLAAADTITNPLFAHLTNVKNRKFARETYKTQRKDALADWQMQNEYNSPRAQMQRYQEAGLNPHLIYGQMGNSSEVRTSSQPSANAEAPRTNAAGNLSQVYQQRQMSAQTDLTTQQIDNMKADKNLKDAQTIATLKSANLTDTQVAKILQDMDFAKGMYPVDIALKNQQLSKQQQEITLAWRKDFREALTMTGNLKEQAERIASLVLGRKKTQADIDKIAAEIPFIKQQLANIKDQNPYDPSVLKIWDGILQRLGFDPNMKLGQEIKDLKNMFEPKKKPWYRQNPTRYQATDSQ